MTALEFGQFRKPQSQAIVRRCMRDRPTTFSRFDRMPTCDGQTDRKTQSHRIYRASIASRGNNDSTGTNDDNVFYSWCSKEQQYRLHVFRCFEFCYFVPVLHSQRSSKLHYLIYFTHEACIAYINNVYIFILSGIKFLLETNCFCLFVV